MDHSYVEHGAVFPAAERVLPVWFGDQGGGMGGDADSSFGRLSGGGGRATVPASVKEGGSPLQTPYRIPSAASRRIPGASSSAASEVGESKAGGSRLDDVSDGSCSGSSTEEGDSCIRGGVELYGAQLCDVDHDHTEVRGSMNQSRSRSQSRSQSKSRS